MSYHLADFYSYFQNIDGEICLTYEAIAKKHYQAIDVIRKFENGKTFIRNLKLGMNGYTVDFVFPENWYEPWCNINGPYDRGFFREVDRYCITNKYPDFKYVLDKVTTKILTNQFVFQLLKVWKEHKEVEFVVSLGFYKIAFDKRFCKLKKDTAKKYIQKMKECKGYGADFKLQDIGYFVKHPKTNVEEYYKFSCVRDANYIRKAYNKEAKFSFDLYSYYIKHQSDINLELDDFLRRYDDYISMIIYLDKDINDSYWRYPKDFMVAHNKALKISQDVEKIREEQNRKVLQTKYQKRIKNLCFLNSSIDGFQIFIPEDVRDWDKQADVLHQCIVQAGYIEKVINKSCLIVFIQKDNVPVATCELFEGYKVGQFYADELDRKNCLPTEDVKKAMYKWIASAKEKVKKIC